MSLLINAPWEKAVVAKRSVWDRETRACLQIALTGSKDTFVSTSGSLKVSVFYRAKVVDDFWLVPEDDKTASVVFIYPSVGRGCAEEAPQRRSSLFRDMVHVLDAINEYRSSGICEYHEPSAAVRGIYYMRKSATKDTPPLIVELLERGERYRVVAYEHVFTGKFSALMKDFNSIHPRPLKPFTYHEFYRKDGYYNKLIDYFLRQFFYEHFFSQYVTPNRRYSSAHYMAALQTIHENPTHNPAEIAATMLPKNPSKLHMWMLEKCYQEKFRSAFVSASRGIPLEMVMSLHGLELA